MRKKESLVKYEEQLARLIERVGVVHSCMEFDNGEFRAGFKKIPIVERIKMFIDVTLMQRDLLDLLRKTVGVKM